MTMSVAPKEKDKSKAPSQTLAQDPQRRLLQQLAALSIECAAEEERIEQEYQKQLAEHREGIARATELNDAKRQKNLAAITQQHEQRLKDVQDKYAAESAAIEQATQKARQQAENEKEVVDEQARKQVEQARWLAESVLEAVETQIDVDSRQAKELYDTRLIQVEELNKMAATTLARFEQPAIAVEPAAGQAIMERLEKEPDALYAEGQQKAVQLLNTLGTLGTPRLVSGGLPFLATPVVILIAAALAQWLFNETIHRVVAGSAAAVLVACLCGFIIVRLKRKARQQVIDVFVPLAQAIDLARRAAETAYKSSEEARKQKERDERRKCAREVDAARDRNKPLQRQAQERKAQLLAEIDAKYRKATQELTNWLQAKTAEVERMHAGAVEAAEHAFGHEKNRVDTDDATRGKQIQDEYDRLNRELLDRWNNGLKTLSDALSDKDTPPAAPLDWNSPAWEKWISPRSATAAVPFGSLKVDLQSLTTHTPRKLALPEAFTIPAILAFPHRGSVLIETDHASRADAINTASLMMARLLTHVPAGRVKFTIIDPVGLGQSFAGFMHLADHDESLVGGRIWTETEHIEQRLADLTEHMETVIQKYLRNEYQTIDEYNAQAGELAEPLRYLVIADFPTGFEQEALRRLASIATSGARCGVYTIILRDTRQPLPQGSHYEELVARSIHLKYQEHKLAWSDEVFAKFPLALDAAPEEKAMTSIMDRVGQAAREAKRVEVPFQTIAPKPEQFWTASSRDELRVAIGKSGATRLQAMRLGVGVAQHALIAGKTGSGKSNLMHTVVTNLAMWYSPDEVEFYLVDFKKGVEFKAYVTRQLPHARAIAVESDREFGLSVLQRVDAELTRRGELFRAAGVQEISSYRQQTRQRMPRTLLLIDEFQEFFSEDDKLGQEAAVLLDRLVRQGRAFGVHVVLGSQTIGGSSGLSRSTIGQMAVRIALQCSEADSQMILGDNNSAARLLSRPGEAIYNDAGGLVEANSPFQIAFLPDEQRDQFLQRIETLSQDSQTSRPQPVVFEGNAPADITKNDQLMALLHKPSWDHTPHAVPAWIGEPVSIKDPTAIMMRMQGGSNVLLIGQQEELSLSVMSSMMVSLAAQHAPQSAKFVIIDGTAADSPLADTLAHTAAALPQQHQIVGYREVDEVIAQLGDDLAAREADSNGKHPAVYLFIYAVQRYRMLRKQEEEFSFSRSEEEQKPKADKVLARLISEGPSLGIHVITWADTAITLDRTFDRGILREFDNRVLFQMSANDSSNLIDSPLANKLGMFRALAYSEEMGTVEKFRPYRLLSQPMLDEVASRLKR